MVDIPERTDEVSGVIIYGVESEQIEEENDAYNDMRAELGRMVPSTALLLSALLHLSEAQFQHFFGPPAVGFGVGLVSVRRRFPVATSIVSRRSSRSYSHQYYFQDTPFGSNGYETSSYTENQHYYTSNNLRYYQPNVFHYHSTPWHYRWGRAADSEARERREARLVEIGDISSIPLNRISDVAANVSIAYQGDIWQNDMIFKDQDDCSKMLICELNRMKSEGKELSETETIIADSFGNGDEMDVAKLSLAFDIAALLGKAVGGNRCELTYRRCEVPVTKMIGMIDIEMKEIENIQKELDGGAINLNDIENRLEEEDEEVSKLTIEELKATTESYYPGRLPLLAG